MKSMSTDELRAMIEKGEPVQVLDIREPDEFKVFHIDHSINIPKLELPNRVRELANDRPVVVACKYGMKSDQVYLFLTEKYKMDNIYVLEGGIYDYAMDIDPTMPID
ncbi:MAG: rhodanese-like domain-containing protein [Bacteroidales bacterium]|nr:rhodanese-like domain-containing protein [Bacteroidales bacterium]